jgi:mannose-1-phosphate guanylyltransferase/mannose-6-phosphate isomerase
MFEKTKPTQRDAPMTQITPLLLAGGSGTRLWPVSRSGFPKQFARLVGPQTLFQRSALRFSGVPFAAPVVITNSDFRFIVMEQLADVSIDPKAVLIEPDGRNTAPAILAAAIHLFRQDPDATILAAPCDHLIPNAAAFQRCVELALPSAKAGKIVTFGIQPDRPETGYGWIEIANDPIDAQPPFLPRRFVEKPNSADAEQMFLNGFCLWNSGIFLFRADTMIRAFHLHANDLLFPVQSALDSMTKDLGFLRLDPAHWKDVRPVSIDYAVMEHADNLVVQPYNDGWSDLGDWAAISRERPNDADGNSGNAVAINCTGSLLESDEAVQLVGIGLTDIVAVALPDAVLVAHKSRAQDVRLAVDALRSKGVPSADRFTTDHRPWGWFETLAHGPRFQVKRIHVHPGGALSLQSHMHRAEHWVVVSGTARVTLDDSVSLLSENQSVYIPIGSKHRLENPGKVPMVLIEVQTGAYLGEDDIHRYDDLYARHPVSGMETK